MYVYYRTTSVKLPALFFSYPLDSCLVKCTGSVQNNHFRKDGKDNKYIYTYSITLKSFPILPRDFVNFGVEHANHGRAMWIDTFSFKTISFYR